MLTYVQGGRVTKGGEYDSCSMQLKINMAENEKMFLMLYSKLVCSLYNDIYFHNLSHDCLGNESIRF